MRMLMYMCVYAVSAKTENDVSAKLLIFRYTCTYFHMYI